MDECRKQSVTDGWMSLSEIRDLGALTLKRVLDKVETWRQALKFTSGLSERNASFLM